MSKKLSRRKIYYVYLLLDICRPFLSKRKFRFEPFYVGKGSDLRANSHVWFARFTNVNDHKTNKIRKIINEVGKDPEILILNLEKILQEI